MKCHKTAKFLSISFVRQIRLPRFAGEANLPPELLATHLVCVTPSQIPSNYSGPNHYFPRNTLVLP